jgi:hypothetical protein
LRLLEEVGLLTTGTGIAVSLTPHGLRVLCAQAGFGTEDRPLPAWDDRARVLTWRGKVVKRLLRPAPAQSTVLAVFQEQGWPEVIDDPLPGLPGTDGAARLRDTVRNLNHGLRRRTIRFSTDGTGEGVRWVIVG